MISQQLINNSIYVSGETSLNENDFHGHYISIKQAANVINFKEMVGKLQTEFRDFSTNRGLNNLDNDYKLKAELNLLQKNVTVIVRSESSLLTRLFDFIFPWTEGALNRKEEIEKMSNTLHALSGNIENAIKGSHVSKHLEQIRQNSLNDVDVKALPYKKLIQDSDFTFYSSDALSSFQNPAQFKAKLGKVVARASILNKDIEPSEIIKAMLVAGKGGSRMDAMAWGEVRDYFLNDKFLSDDDLNNTHCSFIKEAFQQIDQLKIGDRGKITESFSDLFVNQKSKTKSIKNIDQVLSIVPSVEKIQNIEASTWELYKDESSPIKVMSPEERKKRVFQLDGINQLSDGNKKLLAEIAILPDQLEKDLNRPGFLFIGEEVYSGKSAPSYPQLYRWQSDKIAKYIESSNPNLNVNQKKIDEILYSSVQSFINEVVYEKMGEHALIPTQNKSEMCTKFAFENPEVLVVSKLIAKDFQQMSADSQKLILVPVIFEVQVRHNLVTNDVEFVKRIFINGKEETWSPDYINWDKYSAKASAIIVPTEDARQKRAEQMLKGKGLSSGKMKMFEMIQKNPETLKDDLKQQGLLSIASYPFIGVEAPSYHHLYRWESEKLREAISSKSPDLQVSEMKLDEIIFSVSQTFVKDLYNSRKTALPQLPNYAPSKAKKEINTKFKFSGDVLTASREEKTVYVKVNPQDNTNPKIIAVSCEVEVKHNLKTYDVEVIYHLTINGKKESWNP